MKLKELCEILNKSESTLMTNFSRTKNNLEKKGIILTKIGEGKNAEYFIQYKKEDNK